MFEHERLSTCWHFREMYPSTISCKKIAHRSYMPASPGSLTLTSVDTCLCWHSELFMRPLGSAWLWVIRHWDRGSMWMSACLPIFVTAQTCRQIIYITLQCTDHTTALDDNFFDFKGTTWLRRLQLRQQSTIEAWILDVVFYFLQMELPDRRRKRGRPLRICGCSEGGRAKTWFDRGGW